MADNSKINVRNVYIELLNKMKVIEGVDIEYINRLVQLLYDDINLIDIDVEAIKALIPNTATTSNMLATMSDLPAAQVNSDWNATSGVAQILNKPTIPAAQVNSDWNATSGVAQILNKPTIPAAQVNSDWNATSGVAAILNKPTISSVGFHEFTIASGDWVYISTYQYYAYYGTLSGLTMNSIPALIVSLDNSNEYNLIYEATIEQATTGIWYAFHTKTQPTGTIKVGVYYFY